MPNAFRILKPIQNSSKCVWVFRNTGANAVAKNQTRLAYEDKRDLYCMWLTGYLLGISLWKELINYNNGTLKFVTTMEVSGNEKAKNVKYLPYMIVQIQLIDIQ